MQRILLRHGGNEVPAKRFRKMRILQNVAGDAHSSATSLSLSLKRSILQVLQEHKKLTCSGVDIFIRRLLSGSALEV